MAERFSVNEDRVSWTKTDDGAALLNHITSRYVALNETGALLWDALVRGAVRQELVELLLARFDDLDACTAAEDVNEFLGAVDEQGLLVRTREAD